VTSYWCEHALLGDGSIRSGVTVTVAEGVITSLGVGEPSNSMNRLAGLTIPGFANCHSHAFHRALRGRTQRGKGSFWTWREQMYQLAELLDPDTYYSLAKAVYREMSAAGITSVGEFHYLHHGRAGTPYAEPNAMGEALICAAREVGLRIALLDTCYLAAGIDLEVEGVQRRFSDGDVARWGERVEALADSWPATTDPGVVIGAAGHSVRAVPRPDLAVVAAWAKGRGRPLHVHVSEQTAENQACLAAYGCTPTELLAEAGVLGDLTSAVHATQLTDRDIALLGASGTTACFCPTTERDLGDGIGPAPALQAAGSALTLGSDSHAVIDPFEEMRALELNERLGSQERGHWSAAQLIAAGTAVGQASLGFATAGRIAVGAPADLVTLRLDSIRTAGCEPAAETAVFAATAADVVHVVGAGRVIATDADHEQIGRELDVAIAAAWGAS